MTKLTQEDIMEIIEDWEDDLTIGVDPDALDYAELAQTIWEAVYDESD